MKRRKLHFCSANQFILYMLAITCVVKAYVMIMINIFPFFSVGFLPDLSES